VPCATITSGDDDGHGREADPVPMPEMLHTHGARPAMIRPMVQERGSFSRLDIAVMVAFSLLGLVLMYGNATDPDVEGSYLAIPAFLAVTVPLLWRRVKPLEAAAATLVAVLVHTALFGSLVRCGVLFPLSWVLIFSAAARLERGPSLVAFALGFACQLAMPSQTRPSASKSCPSSPP
jgi:hypothetical protein